MLLLLRNAFWYVYSFQLWIWITRITHLMMDDLRLSDFPIYHTSDAKLGHISFSVEICRSSWSHMILITHEMHVELIVYCYLIMIPSGVSFGPFSQAHTFRRLDIITLLLLGYFFDIWIWFSCRHGWLGLHTWWWKIWCRLIFRPTTHLIPY